MGYYTYFELSVDDFDKKNPMPESRYKEIEAEVEKMNIMQDHFSLNEWSTYSKWYDWEEDMLLLSTRFPEMLFTMHGDGEESDDLWYAYFHAGHVQHCPVQLVYPEYDKRLLDKPPIASEMKHYSWEVTS